MPTGERATVTHEWLPLAAIAAVFGLGWLLVSPWRNVPIIDDWVYAWSVEHLLQTGSLRVLPNSSVYPVAQIVWGALFAGVAGFSFGALRLSSVVMAVLGCGAFHLTLRELGLDRRASLLAALTVALSPVYFCLSFSFMTDAVFVSLSSIASFFYVSALAGDRPRRFWWGSLVAVLAFLVRPLGLALPLSALAAIRPREWRTVGLKAMLPIGIALLTMVVLWVAMPRMFGRLTVADQRVASLRYLSMVTFREYATWNINLLIIASFAAAPLFLSLLAYRRRAVVIMIVSLVLIGGLRVMLHELPTPLPDWQTWSLQDFATRGGLFGGELQPSAWSVHLMPILRVAGTVVLAALIVALVAALRAQPAARMILALGLLHLVLINVLWFYNDRYYVVLLPPLAYVAAAQLSGNRAAVWIAAPLLVLWGFISVTGTRDMLATNDVAARLTRELEAKGIPASDIDAGYSLNGWRLFAHPENLPPGADRLYDVPFLNSSRPTRYRIVNTPGPGETVLRVEPLPAALWQVTDRLYVVEHQGAP